MTESNDNEQLDGMFSSILGDEVPSDIPTDVIPEEEIMLTEESSVTEIENINELVEEEINVLTNIPEVITNNPLVISNNGWESFCDLSPQISIIDMSSIVNHLNINQVIIGEKITNVLHTRIITVNSDCKIPMLEDPFATRLFSCNSVGDLLSGFILEQDKQTVVAAGETPETYQHYCYVPFESKSKKLVAFSKNKMVYHVSTCKSDDPTENVSYAPSSRSLSDTLTEEDKIHIKAKFSKKKLAEEWTNLGDAIRDIWSTIHSTLDVNYQRKMLELNKVLCYPTI